MTPSRAPSSALTEGTEPRGRGSGNTPSAVPPTHVHHELSCSSSSESARTRSSHSGRIDLQAPHASNSLRAARLKIGCQRHQTESCVPASELGTEKSQKCRHSHFSPFCKMSVIQNLLKTCGRDGYIRRLGSRDTHAIYKADD